MCGLAGMILTPKQRGCREMTRLLQAFTRLLACSEHRGPLATGVAWVKRDGSYQVEKGPLPARAFIRSLPYATWSAHIDAEVTLLMGHTRWPTSGSILNPNNNHPLEVTRKEGSILLSHNGYLPAVERLFTRYRLPRVAQVDSEFLVQLAARCWSPSGIDICRYLLELRGIEGKISAALMATNHPETIYLFKGNQPLEIVYHPRDQVLYYASEEHILLRALSQETGWQRLRVPAGRAVIVEAAHLSELRLLPFTLCGMHDSPC